MYPPPRGCLPSLLGVTSPSTLLPKSCSPTSAVGFPPCANATPMATTRQTRHTAKTRVFIVRFLDDLLATPLTSNASIGRRLNAAASFTNRRRVLVAQPADHG